MPPDVSPIRPLRAPMIELAWEEPPPSRRGRHSGTEARLRELLETLRGKPGRWARLAVYPSKTSANSARTRLHKHHPKDQWEFQAVVDGATSKLYGRYVGK